MFEDTTGTDGVDWLSADADGITVDAAEGDDYLETDNSNVTLVGGLGDDQIVLGGSDVIVDAGDDDDLIKVTNLLGAPDGPIIVSGGDGADTFNAKVFGAGADVADTLFMRVTDFDPAEDALQIGTVWSSDEVDSFEIVEADDNSYTDVRVTYANTLGIPVVIRLDGATGVTADHITITN